MVLKHVQPKEGEMKQKLRNTKPFWNATSGNRSVCPPCMLTPLSFIPYQSKNREEVIKQRVLIFKRTTNDFRVYILLIALFLFSQYEKNSSSVNTTVQRVCRREQQNFSFHEQVSNFMFHYEG